MIKKLFKSNFILNNWIIFIYIIIAIIIELTGVVVTCGKFYIRNPKIILSIILFFTVILYFVRNQVSRILVATFMLGLQGVLNISFVMLYDLTGQIFDYTMIDLRQDAWGMLESVPLNFTMCFVFGVLYSAFITFGYRFASKYPKVTKMKKIVLKIISLSTLSALCLTASISSSIVRKNFYEELLYSTDDRTYNDLGIMGNTISTLMAGATKEEVSLGSKQDIENFIFDSSEIHYSNFPENYDKEYNVVTILCESFEWMSIVQDLEAYPKGLNLTIPPELASEGKSAVELLFPNLYKFMEESVVFSNFHSKEKTDISENYTHFGSYPTGSLTNYDFAKNAYPTALPNTLKTLDSNIQTAIFHNGYEDFYNRKKYEPVLGFDKYLAAESLEGEDFKIWPDERNLDTEMIEAAKDEMFPTDRRFYSYIITITQHGQYVHRKSLEEQGYYDLLASFGLKENGEEVNDAFVTYVAAALELDRAIGKVNQELEERGLKDNTIVTLFADHNCYYSGLSNHIKDIVSIEQAKENGKNYLDLYRVPLMMRIPGYDAKIIDKFVTTYDILPTILDVLGINYFKNVYYGNSAFDEKESIMYSRAYSFFATDRLYYTSLNRLKFGYKDEIITDDVEKRTKELVRKIQYTDRIFYNDFYAIKLDNPQNGLLTYADLYNFNLLNIQK